MRDPPKGDKRTFTYFVYFLLSERNKDLYIGSTENLENRVSLHNAGKVRSTQFYRPWQLLGYEVYSSRSEAVRRERFLKSHQQREILKKRFGLA
jgi:putative endonuclease